MSRIDRIRAVGVLTAVRFGVMVIHAAPLEPSIPEIQFSFSEAAFHSALAQWQPSGVARFKWHFAVDFPLLLSYGLFGHLLYRHTSSVRSTWMMPLAARALSIAAAMDAVENLLHLSFVYAAMAIPAPLYFVAGLVATLKWSLIAAFALGTGYAALRR